MKKRTLTFLALGSTAILFGCGNKNNDSANGSDGKKVTITYALWDKQQAVPYQELADKFEKDNPNIHVEFQLTPWAQYWTKLETAVTGKNAPDVFWMNIPRSVDYINNGVLEPLNDLNIEKNKFPEQYIETYSHDNKLYGVPKDYDTNGLWYNKKVFDDAGVSYPDETWTWDTWKEAAAKLTNKDKGIYGMWAAPIWDGGYYQLMWENESSPFSKDGKKSTFDDPKSIEAVQFYYDFIKDGSAAPLEETANESATEALLAGKVAMIADGSFQTGVLLTDGERSENIDAAPLPAGKIRANQSNSLANVMYSGSKHKKEAGKWIEYLSSKEANDYIGKSGVVIPAYEGSGEYWEEKFPGKNMKAFVDSVEYGVPLPAFKNVSAATAIEQDIMNDIWTGKVSVEDGCKEIAKKANEILQK